MKIKSYKQISTKRGDKGTSSDYSNNRYMKSNIIFEVLGNVDELSSLLGVTYHYTEFKETIKMIQRRLQDINSLVATTDETVRDGLRQITQEDIDYLEEIEEELMKTTEIKPVFILPGSESTKESAYLDLARSVTRRCERQMVLFSNETKRPYLEPSIKYLNRLSDLFFIMARNKTN